MKLAGISLRTMMFMVALIAFDIAFMTGRIPLLDQVGDFEGVVLIGLLPMANILAFNFPRMLWLGLRRFLRLGRRKPFVVGFQLTSWVTTFAVLVVFLSQAEIVFEFLDSLCPGLKDFMIGLCNTYSQTSCMIGCYKLPPVETPAVGLLESWCNNLMDSVDPVDLICEMGFMAFFSLPPFLVSLAVGLATRFVVRRRDSRFRFKSV